MTNRQQFITSLFDRLTKVEYVLLKHIDPTIESINEQSDLDILISKESAEGLIPWIIESKLIRKITFSDKVSMKQVFLFFHDHSFLQLDFLFGFYRKSLNYLNEKAVLSQAVKSADGLNVCSSWHLLEHLLVFNYLNFSGIPKKYIQYFNLQAPSDKKDQIDYLRQKYNLEISDFKELRVFNDHFRNDIINWLKTEKANQGISMLRNRLNYSRDVIKSIFSNRGFTMTFSGVDGAGKSTILEEVKGILEKKYRRNVVVLRHRPSLLPILSSYRHGKEKAEAMAAEKLPRQGNNKSSIGSYVRFLYYYLDYLLGQFYVKAKFHWRGYIVLYDRYYFDFIVDAKRSNIQMDQAIPRFLYQFVHHPKLNLFLYATPETILKRKQELDSQSIQDLTINYKALFESLNTREQEKYLPIENIDKQETLDQIIEHYETLA